MSVKALMNRQFARWAKSERLSVRALCVAVREIERGLVDAKLGGSLLKKRMAKGHRGKSGGLRTIIAYRQNTGWFFCSALQSVTGPTLTTRRSEPCRSSATSTWR